MKKITLVVAMLGLMVGVAHAADATGAGPYVGINIGAAKSGLGSGDIGGATSFDDKDFAYKLYGGYKIDRNWAVEVAFDDLGTTKYTDTTSGSRGKVDLYALSVAGVGTYQINDKFDVFGKAGVAVIHAKDSVAGATNRTFDNSWVVGAGATYHLDTNVDLKAEWNRYVNVARTGADTDTLGVGVAYSF